MATKEINTGATLYDLNKGLVKEKEVVLTPEILKEKEKLIEEYLTRTNNEYYMMLCKDRSDYTILKLSESTEEKKKEFSNVVIYECLANRGKIKCIDYTADNFAIEMWIQIEEECFCYYLFPYDSAVVII